MSEKIIKAIQEIEKKFGKGSVVNFEDRDFSIKRTPTGSFGLDLATGGGWPKGRIVEIYGPESSGKSTLALHAMKEVQLTKVAVAYIDTEHSFDPIYAENIGMTLSKDLFIFSQPNNGEEAFSIAEELLKTNDIGMIVIDSVAAMTPKAEIDGEFGDAKMGLHARLMGQGMRKLTGLVSKTDCTLIFINQLREKIGIMFGNPETTTGGNALKFYASIRCDIRKTATVSDKDGDKVANQVKVKVIKNKTAPPFKEAIFTIVFGVGISIIDEVIDLAIEWEIVKKSGSWFSYGDTKIGQGREQVTKIFQDNPQLYEEVLAKVKEFLVIE